ncbi:hypothetical protein QAD02_008041 [Eretmocerus hayati]|uniref:Uncharacterized protein n=1 Tax=Eretmocerus hayati TaxID=131215 RepID=A0ACC2N7T2_9HYME|nr:hypothetical protein QAD02_008041 [Eretmocerus hayati]
MSQGVVADTLSKWNLQGFIERFELAGMDEEMFHDLLIGEDDSMLDRLVNKDTECGYHRRFMKNLEKWRQENLPEYNTLPIAEPINDSSPPTLEPNPHVMIDDSTGSDGSLNSSSTSETPSSSQPAESSSLNLSATNVSEIKSFRRLSVKELLETTYKGMKIMGYYRVHKIVKTRLIAEMLIDHEFEYQFHTSGTYRLEKEQFLDWGKQLADIFKVAHKTVEQVIEIFYHVFKAATETEESVNAGGCLYIKYLNERKILTEILVVAKEVILAVSPITHAETDLDFVKNRDGPLDVLKTKWLRSYKDRKVQRDYKKHFELYKGLRSEHGHILWTIDYDFLNPNQPDYFLRWNTITPLILQYTQDKGKFCSSFKVLLEAGKDYIVAFLCLSRLFTTVRRKRTADGEPLFGFTLEDNANAFIFRCNSAQEFSDLKEKRNLHSIQTKRPVGPFITFIGEFVNDGIVFPEIQPDLVNQPEAPIADAANELEIVVAREPEILPGNVQGVSTFKMSFTEIIENEMMSLTLEISNNQLIPRSVVQEFVDKLISFSRKKMVEYVLKEVSSIPACDKKTIDDVHRIFRECADIMAKFDTEFKRFEEYKQRGLLLMPEQFELRHFSKTSSAQHVSLPWTLKSVLEIPGSFKLLMNHITKLEKEFVVISSFIQGDYWREYSKSFNGRIVIPLFILHDDFTSGNALGSHAEDSMVGDVFISLPGYPPHMSCKLSNLFLTDLFNANDRKEFGNHAVFSKLIRDLKYLEEEGLNIQVEDRNVQVYFSPSLYIGDNKGINEDLGMTPSFIHGCCCRICKADVNMMRTMILEELNLLRTEQNYESDLLSKCPPTTGLLEECCFNQLSGFHFVDNAGADLMHDEFEGNANILLAKVIHDLIYKDEVFTLDWLNKEIDTFQKNTSDISNRIPEIKKHHLTNGKLKMSSSEMMTLVRFFGLIVGKKFDSEESEIWSLFLMYREIIDYLLSPRYVGGHLLQLEFLIPEFLSLFIKLYKYLTFKLHMMIHLVRLMRKFGPMIHYWAMHLETKHRELKIVATTSNNTKNVLKTIGFRSQLKMAYFKSTGSLNVKKVEANSYKDASTKVRLCYFPDVSPSTPILTTKHVIYQGIEFSVGKMLVTEMGDNDLLEFGFVEDIFIVNEDVFLLLTPHTTIHFDRNVYSYLVVAREISVLKNIENLPKIHPCALSKVHNSLYVTPKYVL